MFAEFDDDPDELIPGHKCTARLKVTIIEVGDGACVREGVLTAARARTGMMLLLILL